MASRMVLEGVRVVEHSENIAGPYCAKVLADAGADVVKVEAPDGDPLRSHGSGALFEFLNTSKRSVHGEPGALLARADLFVTDQPGDVVALRSRWPSLVIVTVTPFGCAGPWVGRPWTEFTLQAACGSTGQRGLPDGPPLAAGGRLGEWTAGTYAALGALAALREARRSGHGDHVDVAILDCMAVAMVTYPSVFSSFFGWPALHGTGRSIEVPSIEPCRDGFVVFTTNSAQQFQDFLVMIERPDLLDQPELARAAKRFTRREEFLRAVRAHTGRRTTSELLEEAAAFRIPAAPVLNGTTIPHFEPFEVRGAFVESPTGRFVQPRVPYRISGTESRPFARAPANGQHSGAVGWGEPDPRPHRRVDEWRLPLSGTRVLDCTAWWAGPSATHALACLGADVIKVESTTRPDQMRFASTRSPDHDRWWEWGPIFHGVNICKRAVTLDLTRPEGIGVFERLAGTADVVVENYTPRVMEQFGLGWERLRELNPALVMVRMPAFGLDGPWRDRTGFAQTMECLSGMAWLTGPADGPPVLVRGACDPVAGVHSAIAAVLALIHRDGDGAEEGGGDAPGRPGHAAEGPGGLVESVMVEAALNAAAEQVVEYGCSGRLLRREGNRGPVGAPQGVYQGAGEDRWVALAVTTDEQWRALCRLVDQPAWLDRAFSDHESRRLAHDAIDRDLSRWISGRDVDEAAAALSAAGVPAAVVVPARDIVHNPQLRSRSLFEMEHHPVTGDHEIPMLPFRLSRVDHWLSRPSPTLGQHNDEILTEVGLGEVEITRLGELGIVGDRLAGA